MLSLETKIEMLQLGNLNIKGKCFIVLIKKKTLHVVVSNSKIQAMIKVSQGNATHV